MRRLSKFLMFVSLGLLLGQASVFAKTKATEQTCDANGWCNVPLTDTQIFDINCQYRFDVPPNLPEPGAANFRYATVVFSKFLETISQSVQDADKQQINQAGPLPNTYIFYNKKDRLYAKELNGNQYSYTVTKIQKRCTSTPKGQVSMFHLTSCPTGWKSVGTLAQPANDFVYCEKE